MATPVILINENTRGLFWFLSLAKGKAVMESSDTIAAVVII